MDRSIDVVRDSCVLHVALDLLNAGKFMLNCKVAFSDRLLYTWAADVHNKMQIQTAGVISNIIKVSSGLSF